MSLTAMNWCYTHSPFRGAHGKFLCHLTVANVVNEDHGLEFWMGQQRLAKLAGVTRRTVNEFFAEALDMGLLTLVEDNGKAGSPNRYRWPSGAMKATLAPPSEADGVSNHFSGGEQPLRRGVSNHFSGGEQPLLTKQKEPKEEPKTDETPPTPPQAGGGSGGDDVGQLLLLPSVLDRKKEATESLAKRVRCVFDAWVRITGRDPTRTKLDSARRRKIETRLADGYSVEECIEAIEGILLSPFHMGDNDREKRYDDITLILRDAKQIEKFRDLYERGGAPDGKRTDVVDRVFAKIAAGESIL